MSAAEVNRLLSQCATDVGLRTRLAETEDLHQAIQVAQAAGFDVAPEELAHAAAEGGRNTAELNAREMDAVAGGVLKYDATGGGPWPGLSAWLKG